MTETWACFCSLETSFGGVTIEIRIPRHNISDAMVHVAGGQNAAARCRLSVVYLAMWYRVSEFSIERFRQSGLTSQDACRWRRGNRDFGVRHGDDQEIEGDRSWISRRYQTDPKRKTEPQFQGSCTFRSRPKRRG